MRMEDEPQGTVCRLVTPCTWGFQEIVLGGTPAAELRGIEAEGVSERDERDPRRRWGSHERRRRRGAQEDEAAPKVVTQGEPARKRQRAEAGECSESLGSVDRIKGRTTCSAPPAPETSSGNTEAAPLQTADYLQREVLKQALEVERDSSRRLRIDLDRMMNNRT
uniref:Uncharacterized protein n=1 Tax=Chloropicon roscoffensis TaxID=1461544 RepID=A0A7S2T8E1_9CHLO